MSGVFKVLTAADIPAGGQNDITALPPAPYVEEVNILKDFRNAPIMYLQSLPHGRFEHVFLINFLSAYTMNYDLP